MLLSLFVVFTITGCSLIQQEYEYVAEEFMMDTFVKLKVYDADKAKAEEVAQKALDEFKRIELLTNRYAQEGTAEYAKSDVIKLNLAAGHSPVQVDKDVLAMLSLCKKYNKEFDGAFDVTIGPVVDLWGFGTEKKSVPSDEKLEERLELVDSNKMVLDEEKGTAYLVKEKMSLDLGGIAKGYATEQAAQLLRDDGIKKALINAGGNIYAIGEKDKNIPWMIGIQDPRNPDKIIGILKLKDQVAVTSGDYQRYFEVDGKRYHHILDPRTGKPASNMMSVTVVADNSALADILSTSFFVMGVEQSLAYIAEHPGVEAVFVTQDKRIIYSPGLEGVIELEKDGGYKIDQGR